MRRGEVWLAELALPIGRRPVLLLSRDEAYSIRVSITVAPVTGRVRGIPTEVSLGKREGLTSAFVVNLDDITTIPKSLLQRRLGALQPAKIDDVEAAIRFALAIPS